MDSIIILIVTIFLGATAYISAHYKKIKNYNLGNNRSFLLIHGLEGVSFGSIFASIYNIFVILNNMVTPTISLPNQTIIIFGIVASTMVIRLMFHEKTQSIAGFETGRRLLDCFKESVIRNANFYDLKHVQDDRNVIINLDPENIHSLVDCNNNINFKYSYFSDIPFDIILSKKAIEISYVTDKNMLEVLRLQGDDVEKFINKFKYVDKFDFGFSSSEISEKLKKIARYYDSFHFFMQSIISGGTPINDTFSYLKYWTQDYKKELKQLYAISPIRRKYKLSPEELKQHQEYIEYQKKFNGVDIKRIFVFIGFNEIEKDEANTKERDELNEKYLRLYAENLGDNTKCCFFEEWRDLSNENVFRSGALYTNKDNEHLILNKIILDINELTYHEEHNIEFLSKIETFGTEEKLFKQMEDDFNELYNNSKLKSIRDFEFTKEFFNDT